MDLAKLLGRPPIHPALLVAAKALMAPPCLFLAYSALALARSTRPWTGAAFVGAALAVAGLTVLAVAIRQLGDSTRVGLPEEATELKTHGLYRHSRNPIYTGLLLAGVGSCLIAPHWVNIGASLGAALLHHRIVLAEERFLETRFGDAWRQYRARVRRYL